MSVHEQHGQVETEPSIPGRGPIDFVIHITAFSIIHMLQYLYMMKIYSNFTLAHSVAMS